MGAKKTLSRIVSGIVCAGSLAACGDDGGRQGVYPEAVVGVSISNTQVNPFFQEMYNSFESAAKANSQLKVMLESADDDQQKQNAQIQKMLEQGAKALVVNLVDVGTGGEFVKKMCDAKIPVVYIDRSPGVKNLSSCETAFLVDGDAMQGGVLQGLQVLAAWKVNPQWDKNRDGVIQYAMIEGIPNHAGAMARTKWSAGTMESYPNLGVRTQKVLQDTAMFRQDMAGQLIAKWARLPEFSRVEVILANNDSMALGASDALKKTRMQVPVFGIDGLKEAVIGVRSGRLAGTVFNDYDGQARTALRMAANLAAGRQVSEGLAYAVEYQSVKIPYQDINSGNIEHFLKLNQ